MVAPRKYPDELRERAIRLVLDANLGLSPLNDAWRTRWR
jgi:hypothetical protein